MKTAKIFDFLFDESGATAVEYALIAGIVSVSIIVGLRQLSLSLNGSLNATSNELDAAAR